MNMDIKTTPLGHTFTYTELLNHFRAVWGGVARPGKREGAAVVIGMDHKRHLDSHDIYLLDEYESFDTRKLVRQCGALDAKYSISLSRAYCPNLPGYWIGDYKNDAASQFIHEMNDEQKRDGSVIGREPFSLTSTSMLEMENLYEYILPQIKELRNAERRQLFLKESKILNYLSEIEEAEMAELERGEYPAIEALAFAVIELRKTIAAKERTAHIPAGDPWPTGNPVDNFLKS